MWPSGGVLVVAENRLQPIDPALLRHVGVRHDDLDVIAVRSANHYRAASESISSLVPIDSPGLDVMHPQRFPGYDRIRRPTYPLDSVDEPDSPGW